MFDPVSAVEIVRVISSAYLLSACFLLSFTSGTWWLLSFLEHPDTNLSKWFG
jgi:hypothetical protein